MLKTYYYYNSARIIEFRFAKKGELPIAGYQRIYFDSVYKKIKQELIEQYGDEVSEPGKEVHI